MQPPTAAGVLRAGAAKFGARQTFTVVAAFAVLVGCFALLVVLCSEQVPRSLPPRWTGCGLDHRDPLSVETGAETVTEYCAQPLHLPMPLSPNDQGGPAAG